MPTVLDKAPIQKSLARTHKPPKRSRTIDPENLPKGFELVNGKLKEKHPMGFQSGFLTTQLIILLGQYFQKNPIAILASSDATFACVPDNPKQVRKPDIAVILCDPKSFVPPVGNYTQAPDMIIEVLSPTDTFYDVYDRVEEFLKAGTKQVWLVNPRHHYVEVHHSAGNVEHYKNPNVIVSALLPGFELSLEKLFSSHPRV